MSRLVYHKEVRDRKHEAKAEYQTAGLEQKGDGTMNENPKWTAAQTEKRQAAAEPARRAALYGMLIALAFVFSYLESLLPISLGVPGVKLGLANLVTVVGLYTIGVKGTAAVSLVRILLAGFTFGNGFSMAYSLAGGIVSLLVMALCKRKKWFSQVGVSVLGGVAHNLGQLAVAALVVENAGVFAYFPVLLLTGCAAGACIGVLGGLLTERVGRFLSGKNTGNF